MSTRPEGLVVGYDGSDRAQVAVDWAAAEAQRRGCSLTVLSVTNHGLWQGESPWAPELASLVQGVAHDLAEQGAERARAAAPGLEVQVQTQAEGVARALIEASASAELTVVGSRGHGEVLGAALGSVAFTVSAHAHSPVVVVRGTSPRLPGPDGAVVVGADGSDHSNAAIAFAAGLAAETGAPLTIVSAYRSVTAQAYSGSAILALANAPATPLESAASFDEIVREAAEKTAVQAGLHAIALHPALRIVEFVAEGSPVEVLRKAAEGCALVVVGSRGRGAFASLTLGSVSHGIIHAAGCPVAVVRDAA
jgi:nucleotide-binding universal stress UspA family protein